VSYLVSEKFSKHGKPFVDREIALLTLFAQLRKQQSQKFLSKDTIAKRIKA
jgi:hypothetical protein